MLDSGSQAGAGSGTEEVVHRRLPFRLLCTDSLMARLDRVPAAKSAAKQASVIGREFSYGMLAAIGPAERTELQSALEQLVSSELIFVRKAPPEATYTFKHALVRDAAYASLLKSRRRELHARVAAILEQGYPDVTTRQPELIAHHLSEARLAERAALYWQRRRRLMPRVDRRIRRRWRIPTAALRWRS